LVEALTERFTAHVMEGAKLPSHRRRDVAEAVSFAADRGELRCTCGITGSTYFAIWDSSDTAAFRLADEAAQGTVSLVTGTRYYPWLWSRDIASPPTRGSM
jgi:hypothetical protein